MNITKTLIIPGMLLTGQAHAMEPEPGSNELSGALPLNQQFADSTRSVEDCFKILESISSTNPLHQQMLASGIEVIKDSNASEEEKKIVINYLMMAVQNNKQ